MPDFAPRLTFHATVPEMIGWRAARTPSKRPGEAAADVDAILDRLVGGHHAAREIFTALGAAAAPQPDD